jgi:O-acetyl-ADP-ribose deacetylase
VTDTKRQLGQTTLRVLRGNIVEIEADAIVNAANSRLAGGGGVDGAIHRSGGPAIMQECRGIGSCSTGSAVMTGAGLLRARHVIHAVAPFYRASAEDARLLASAYRSSLELAERHDLRSIAFPSLGTGAYRYPIDEAAPIALQTVATHLRAGSKLREVLFVLFSDSDLQVYTSALHSL